MIVKTVKTTQLPITPVSDLFKLLPLFAIWAF